MARQDEGEAEYLSERKNKGSLLKGAAVYDALVAAKSPWLRRIRRPNEPLSKDKSIAVSQFINSLVPLQSAQMPRELSPDEWARIIDAFWEAIAALLPAAARIPDPNSLVTGFCLRLRASIPCTAYSPTACRS